MLGGQQLIVCIGVLRMSIPLTRCLPREQDIIKKLGLRGTQILCHEDRRALTMPKQSSGNLLKGLSVASEERYIAVRQAS